MIVKQLVASLGVAWAVSTAAVAAPIFSEDFDDGNAATRWTTVSSNANTLANYAFDYSGVLDFNSNPIGVPQTGQTTHTGLKLAANLSGGTPAGVAGINAYANGLNLTGSVVMTFDMYAYFNDTAGSTIYGTYGFYHSTQTGTWNSLGSPATSGYWFTNSSDNGTSVAMRGLEVGTQDNTASRYLDGTQNPGSAAGVTYKALFPDLDGAGAKSMAGYVLNRWVNVRISRDMLTGDVKWEMKNPGDASYTQVYKVTDATQTQNSGTITLGMTDPFSSASGPNTYFIYDNVMVIPEPSSLVLCFVGLASLLATRKRG
ncbi:MAG: hypothetical protein IT425_13525 [Pirellulales bacterium]|nr:hypothetical protein [Pirellulales bacterium]